MRRQPFTAVGAPPWAGTPLLPADSLGFHMATPTSPLFLHSNASRSLGGIQSHITSSSSRRSVQPQSIPGESYRHSTV